MICMDSLKRASRRSPSFNIFLTSNNKDGRSRLSLTSMFKKSLAEQTVLTVSQCPEVHAAYMETFFIDAVQRISLERVLFHSFIFLMELFILLLLHMQGDIFFDKTDCKLLQCLKVVMHAVHIGFHFTDVHE